MSRYFIPILSPLILLISFWLFFYSQENILVWSGISALTVLVSVRLIARKYFWRSKILWVNLLTVYISEILFLLLLTSGSLRFSISFLFSILWGFTFYLLIKYFKNIDKLSSKDYLSFNKFLYYLSFWMLASSLFSLIVFINLLPAYALLIILFISFLWAKEIISLSDDSSRFYVWFVMFLLAQVLVVAYFLPVSFYVNGTIATLWFFLIIDNAVSNLKNFRVYLSIFLVSLLVLLITSII